MVEPTETLRLLLVDDHTIFRQSLRLMLGNYRQFAIVGEASDGVEAIAKARELVPDVILMDINMPRCNGLAAVKELQRDWPGINVIMLTVSEGDDDLFASVKAGARGYLLKTIDAEELVRALEHVSRGGAVISPMMAGKLLAEFAALETDEPEAVDAVTTQLTAREKELLELVGQGLSNREIAAALYVTESTVKTHLRNIMEKLHIHNRAQAVAFAARCNPAPKRRSR